MGERIARRLTVLQVLPALQGGGVERSTLEVAAALVRHGHRSLVVSNEGRLVPGLLASGSEHICWPVDKKSPLALRHVPRLRRLLRKEGVDILHARSRLPAWLAWLAWRGMEPAARPRFVTTVHGLNSVNAYSRVMLRGERVIAVSDAARAYVLQHYPGMEPGRIRVIPRGVDTAVFPPGYRPRADWLAGWYRQYPRLRNRYVVTLPGRISRRKGIDDFTEIIAGLAARGVPAHGLLVGELPPGRRGAAAVLRARIAAAGLDGSITLTGFREDVRDILAVSGAVLSLSRCPEAFGRTVNEALSLRIPVAGYAHGGVGEQLQRHFPAGAVPPADVTAMIGRLQAWYQTPPSMADVSVYRLQDMLDSTLALYHELQGDA
ncbi:MAG TPA: glycosyltransferase family 4 protein [Gammaproteobacteria bacterium]|nr:glycosyltransferase family 4 protein [Gammaproteobacteria bacterium]